MVVVATTPMKVEHVTCLHSMAMLLPYVIVKETGGRRRRRRRGRRKGRRERLRR